MATNTAQILFTAALAILLSTSALAGAGTTGIGLARQIAVFADGHLEERYTAYDVGADRVWMRNKARTEWISRALSQSAAITNTFHWERGASIALQSTETAYRSRNAIRRILSSYADMRGTTSVPTFTLTDDLIEVRPPEDFSDLASWVMQLDMDGISSIAMTEDDLLLDVRMGGPGALFAVTIHLTAQVSEAENRLVGEARIIEADIYLPSFFFGQRGRAVDRYMVHTLLMALGYQHTCWPSDLLGITNLAKSDLKVFDTESPMGRLLQERDRFYYADPLPLTAAFHEEPRMMPAAETAIDLSPYLELPTATAALFRPVIGLTNLLAFDGGLKLLVRIQRVDEGPPPKLRKLVKLNGNLADWPTFHPAVGFWYPTVFLNEVRLGREQQIGKLRSAVERYGAPAVIEGVEWESALRVRLKVTGRRSEDGPKRTLTRYLYLTDSTLEAE